jgi:hypothetical protein
LTLDITGRPVLKIKKRYANANSIFTLAQVKRIKASIWKGEDHALIAERMGCSKSVINAIARGARWKEVPFPDGSIGYLCKARLLAIARARMQARQASKRAMADKIKAILKNGVHTC